MMIVETKYKIGDIVYLVTDNEQYKRMVTGILVKKDNTTYELSCGVEVTWHYDFEISINKDVLMTTNN